MRLDKLLSQQLGISRSEATRKLKMGMVRVNEQVVKIGRHIITPQDKVFDGVELLDYDIAPRYFMLNKPKGYVCTNNDPHYPAVNYLLNEKAKDKLFPVGRLDSDTTGLVLLTDDGAWAHRIMSPRYRCSKVYRVKLFNVVTEQLIEQFAVGMLLKGDKYPTLPAELEILASHEARIRLSEGRYHQVKRMFAAQHNHVVALHRESIGAVQLDPTLAEGEYRALTAQEQQCLLLKYHE